MWTQTRQRFSDLAQAFDGSGGYAPVVRWRNETLADGSTRRLPDYATASFLVPYARESAQKYAGRAALATYENHLRSACERFCGFLARRRAVRTDADAPLVKLLLDDADLRGNSLDTFLSAFALQAKARGSMLLLVDLARDSSPLLSLLDQVQRRRVPYLRAIAPELVDEFDVDDETGLLERVRIKAIEIVGGKAVEVDREWTHEGWSVRRDGTVVAEGTHPFGQCPALAFTESGDPFPVVGKYSQVADLSRRIFNARSELDEILRSQTFSLLTLQVPPEADDKAVAGATAAIGTHSMLVHRGTTAPSFIAPDSGPAQTYLAVIDQLQASIRRVTMEESTSDASSAAESGVARRMRFEALNADLAVFASRMQQLERRMWALFHRALGTTPRNTVEWPSDFNLLDTQAELDILLSMQSTGFPPLVQAAKRKAIAGAEFDAADEETKAAVMAAIDEQAQEAPAGAPLPST
ncbi:MAG: hypothetical protein U1F25_13670 [Rubrivivax sp.]